MGQHTPKHRTTYSAGGVCYRLEGEVPEVVLIATLGGARWGLPKGQPENDETPAEAARREIAEETGILGEVLHSISCIEYWFRSGPARIHKSVEFFLMRCRGGQLQPQLSEVDDVRWVPLPEALRMVSFPREREVLERVWRQWKDQGLG